MDFFSQYFINEQVVLGALLKYENTVPIPNSSQSNCWEFEAGIKMY